MLQSELSMEILGEQMLLFKKQARQHVNKGDVSRPKMPGRRASRG